MDNNDNLHWSFLVILVIAIGVMIYSKVTGIDIVQYTKDKISGVEVVDEREKQRNKKENSLSYSDRDVVDRAIRAKYDRFKRKDFTIRSVDEIELTRSNNEFSLKGTSTNGRTVYIKGTVKKKNSKLTINHDKIVID